MSYRSATSKLPKRFDLVLGIHPEHVSNILSGLKRVELRRVMPKKPVIRLWIYETAPTSRVVAVCDVDHVVHQEKSILWRTVERFSGIDKEMFDQYFHDKQNATGIMLSRAQRLNRPILLAQLGVKGPPQGIVYIDHESASKLLVGDAKVKSQKQQDPL